MKVFFSILCYALVVYIIAAALNLAHNLNFISNDQCFNVVIQTETDLKYKFITSVVAFLNIY